jgi:hypothetical protein
LSPGLIDAQSWMSRGAVRVLRAGKIRFPRRVRVLADQKRGTGLPGTAEQSNVPQGVGASIQGRIVGADRSCLNFRCRGFDVVDADLFSLDIKICVVWRYRSEARRGEVVLNETSDRSDQSG